MSSSSCVSCSDSGSPCRRAGPRRAGAATHRIRAVAAPATAHRIPMRMVSRTIVPAAWRLRAASGALASVLEKSSCSNVPSAARETQVPRRACKNPTADSEAGTNDSARQNHGTRSTTDAVNPASAITAHNHPNRIRMRRPAVEMFGLQDAPSVSISIGAAVAIPMREI